MKKILLITSVVLAAAILMTLNFAPDTMSIMIVALMMMVMGWGYLFGIVPTLQYMRGFEVARQNLDSVRDVQAESKWTALQKVVSMFHQKSLDKLFDEYSEKVKEQQKEGKLLSDLVEYINEDALALRSWQNVVQQIPGTLTALGLLGTFIGLIIGISDIGFSSVDAALSSIEVLLSGIRTAFYTSIAGVIFSILFNLIYRLIWNAMLRQMGIFIEEFHRNVLPSMEDQLRDQNLQDTKKILEKLERLPKTNAYMNAAAAEGGLANAGEQQMMKDIQDGLQNGEFVFFVQPRFDLNSKQLIGGEALLRWNHSKMGLISASNFVPMLERNNYISRIDRYIWQEVCKTIRRWIDMGYRPVPLAVNVSKSDIMSMEVAEFFDQMIQRYRIPPRYLEVEIAKAAYLDSRNVTREVAIKLRQAGFRVIVDGITDSFNELAFFQDIQADAVKMNLNTVAAEDGQTSRGLKESVERIGSLKLPMIATYIESAAQVTVLRGCGIAEGEGTFFSKAVSLEEFEEMSGQRK